LDVENAAFPLYSDPLASARAAAACGIGINWYLNRSVMVKANCSQTRFTGGGGPGTSAPATITQQDEKVCFTRVQLAF
jgi:phosphate-selective porin OprO and OprP